MQQRLSKLEAAQRLGVSPSTLDRMIRRGELEIEREGRGDRAKVWVLAPGLSSDAPGGQPVDAGPSPEAELAAAREQVRALQELADYRGKLLDEAEWRYRELLEELRRSQAMLEGLTRALPPGRDGGVTPGMALVALRTGLDGFLAFPPQAGAETRCTTGPTSRRLLHPGPCGFGPAVPGGAGPRCRSAGAVVAPGPGPWTPSAASEALRSCCAPLQVVFPSMLPRREQCDLCSCALTPGLFPAAAGVLEVWPESHWPAFALRQADVFQSYTAW